MNTKLAITMAFRHMQICRDKRTITLLICKHYERLMVSLHSSSVTFAYDGSSKAILDILNFAGIDCSYSEKGLIKIRYPSHDDY